MQQQQNTPGMFNNQMASNPFGQNQQQTNSFTGSPFGAMNNTLNTPTMQQPGNGTYGYQ